MAQGSRNVITQKSVTNAEIMAAVIEMQRQMNEFTSADGWGGRVLLLENGFKETAKDITSLQHEISGNGKPGVKKDLVEVRSELQEVKHNVKIVEHNVKTMLAITKWVMTPIFGILVGVIISSFFGV